MATPIKLTKHFYDFQDGRRVYRTSNTLFLNLDTEKTLFDIQETDNVSLVFDFLPSEYRIEIEDSESGEYISVHPGKEFDLHMPDDPEEDIAYYPGYFDVQVTKGEECKKGYFCVHPKVMDMDSVLHLRSYVNNYYDGLSLDLERKRKMKVSFEDQSAASDFTSYSFLIANYPSIMNYMNRYVRGTHDQLIKKETVSNKAAKVSQRSLKWLVQKGYTKNSNINKPSVLLTEKTVFTSDNEQNRAFKSFVVYWDNELGNMLVRLSDYQRNASNTIVSLTAQLEQLVDEYERMRTIKSIPDFVKKQAQGKIKDKEKEISSMNDLLNVYKERYSKISHYKIFTDTIRFNTWISKVNEEVNYTQKMTYSKELLLLKETRDRYIGAKRRSISGKSQKIDYFAQKSTPKLFETYIYIMLIDILNSHGFEITDNELYGNDLMFSLSTKSNIVMKNDGGLIYEIIYDMPLENAQNGLAESDYCTINSSHNRPDFILSLRNQDGELLNTIVIEAKWRSLRNIYNENGDTKVMLHLKDYANLAYYNAVDKSIKPGVISKVIALYPDINETYFDAMAGGLISYLSISVNDNIKESDNYHLLKKIVLGEVEIY